jgi:hypothetical protein
LKLDLLSPNAVPEIVTSGAITMLDTLEILGAAIVESGSHEKNESIATQKMFAGKRRNLKILCRDFISSPELEPVSVRVIGEAL